MKIQRRPHRCVDCGTRIQAVVRLSTSIRNSLERRDPMWVHFDKVVAFCNERAAEARKLLEEPRVKLTDGD